MFPLKQLHTKRLAAMEKKSVAAKPKTSPDWERIELDYRAGIKSLRQIGEEHAISEGAVRKRAKRDEWERERATLQQEQVRLTGDELDRAGFVYVIYLEGTAGERFYKIGMSASFTARYDAHQCASPFPLCVACAYFVGNMRAEERFLHAVFAGERVRGEWFRLTNADLDQIARRAKLV